MNDTEMSSEENGQTLSVVVDNDQEESQGENCDCSEVEKDQLSLQETDHVALVEAVVFASGEAIGIARIKMVTGLEEKEIKDILESITMKYELEDCGIELRNVAGKFQFRTKSQFAPFIQKLKVGRPRRLTPAALETLAVIAYRQPIVKSDIEKIRGVDATPTIKTLLERKLIKIVGHKATIGQPALYGSTDEFLRVFGLRSLSELPTLRDLKELEEDPGEVEESKDSEEELEETTEEKVVEADVVSL